MGLMDPVIILERLFLAYRMSFVPSDKHQVYELHVLDNLASYPLPMHLIFSLNIGITIIKIGFKEAFSTEV